MTKLPFLGLAALVLATSASADPRETSPDDKSCENPSLPTMTVRVTGLKSGAGKVRVQAYGPGGSSYLDKGKWIRRVDMPAIPRGWVVGWEPVRAGVGSMLLRRSTD